MPTPLSFRFFCACALLGASAVRAQLAAVSPFLPPQGKGNAAPTADAPLEYRGVAELPDGPAFRVVDPTRKVGSWVRLHERDSDLGVVIKGHDAEHETVTVEQQGRTFTLALHQSKVASSGAALPTPMVMPVQTMQVPTIAAMAPRPPLQQAQIDAVAAAVAQRRAARDQAAQQINQGVPIAPQVIQQQQQQRAQKGTPQNQNVQNATNAAGGQNGQNNQRKRNRQP